MLSFKYQSVLAITSSDTTLETERRQNRRKTSLHLLKESTIWNFKMKSNHSSACQQCFRCNMLEQLSERLRYNQYNYISVQSFQKHTVNVEKKQKEPYIHICKQCYLGSINWTSMKISKREKKCLKIREPVSLTESLFFFIPRWAGSSMKRSSVTSTKGHRTLYW